MVASKSPANPLLLPTGEFHIPVCVGDMPSHRYQVPIETVTEVVTVYLEAHPDVPGVILMDGDRIHSLLPRLRIFERLGHLYGVDLFLRKPIIELQNSIQSRTYIISSNIRIQDAAREALNRPPDDVYDPLVVNYGNQDLRVLDMYALLIAQSQALQSMNNLMSSLANLERMIDLGSPFEEILARSLSSLRRVVPYHQVVIHVRDPHSSHLLGMHPTLYSFDRQLPNNIVFQTVLNIRQPMQVNDTSMVPGWRDNGLFNDVRSWMGVPLMTSHDPLGVLSLIRYSDSPFNKEEMDMAESFSRVIGRAMQTVINNGPDLAKNKERVVPVNPTAGLLRGVI